MPVGCDDNVLPWGKSLPNPLETKHPFVCHAELNAFLNASTSELSGCRDKSNKWEMMASRKMFDESGVKYRPFSCSVSNVILELQPNTSDTVDTVITEALTYSTACSGRNNTDLVGVTWPRAGAQKSRVGQEQYPRIRRPDRYLGFWRL
ncbi:probable deoxycytidylate deaminase [Trichinella spiralis]|uniref:probable deoxycytidylate deaminase n=1 Tax=Trichinella spiralis TaxID=6334 RepID=UPI0001EFD64E|nr:probable deoxycytidylate deaminase [Trichinella spiralis]